MSSNAPNLLCKATGSFAPLGNRSLFWALFWGQISNTPTLYQAVAQGQSCIQYLSINSLYPHGVCLTGSPFDSTSPLLALRGGRGAKIPNFNLSNMASSKKRSYQTAQDISPDDEQTFSPTEHWRRFTTLEAVLIHSQHPAYMSMTLFVINPKT